MGWVLIHAVLAAHPPAAPGDIAVVVLALLALLLWLVQAVTEPHGTYPLALLIAGLAISNIGTNGLGAVSFYVMVSRLTANPVYPLRRAVACLTVGCTAIMCGIPLDHLLGTSDGSDPLTTVLICLVVPLLLFMGGLIRRQRIQAQETATRALQSEVAAAHERARYAAAEERATLARDLHDVLAHTLGGLTIQLDTLEAELEAGQTHAALERAGRARALAGDGLAEARNAVAALRAPAQAGLNASVADLLAAHRQLGGRAELTGAAANVPPEVAQALAQILRECLSNARRHSPGALTRIEITATPANVRMLVATPRSPDDPSAAGGGFGLTGIVERARALQGSATFDRGDPFTVRVTFPYSTQEVR